ncbi:ABC transporter permease [Cryobacterium sp. TMT2-15-1]|uniref:FtsX-like permease family protein n=1 Tax=Cryobacterium sp. TMT2-15-1 TaxID=1259246 RepID=UPI00106A0185|nr:FtsX-like permease family protein [Cryobacterium sp. TMT2-15-1]TFC54070.1 ABC transporter permease [Cryobacterium sp. TMT2-15-1]
MNFELTKLLTMNNRESKKRLVGVSAGIAVGVALLLLIWGAYNGMQQRELRSAWTQLGGRSAVQVSTTTDPLTTGHALAFVSGDYYQGNAITRVTVAALPGSTVRIPGTEHFPEPGTYFASPALAELINAVPADQLGDRYGTSSGEVPDAALASPDSLVVIVGQTPESLAAEPGAVVVSEFTGRAFGGNWAYLTLAIIGGIAILIPVLLLVSIVTGLGATERRERFATLRLIGATPTVVARIAATETAVTGAIGALAGATLALLLAPLAARVPVDGSTFFVADILVDPISATVVVVATVAVTTAVAWWRARRAGFGPLGNSRQQHERPPRALSLVPLVTGVAALVSTAIAPSNGLIIPGAQLIILVGFVLTTTGLVIAGPYLTFLTSRMAARYTRSAAGVVAFNRIRRLPRTTFRSVSGLVIALFLVSVFATAVTTVQEATAVADDAEHLSMSTLINRPTAEPTEQQLAALSHAPGVAHVGLAYFRMLEMDGPFFSRTDAQQLGLIPASQRATITTEFVAVNPGFEANEPIGVTAAPGIKRGDLVNPILLIATDGTPAGLEQARTVAILSGIEFYTVPSTRAELQSNYMATLGSSFAGLANLGILITALISVISLAVATIGGILDRRRVIGLLRLMGMPVRTLRRIIASETALPLGAVFGACIALGVTVAWALVAGLSNGKRAIDWPGPSYYIVITLSVILAALSVLTTFKSAEKNTGITTTRYE